MTLRQHLAKPLLPLLRQDIAKAFLRRSYIASRIVRSLGEVAEAYRTVHLIG